MVNLEYYKVFYHVAKLQSITLASQELFISQPAVSQAIKHLEEYLGGCLFYRTPKGVRLTTEGEVLFSYVSQGYEYFSQAESKYRELLDLEAGEIRIGASDMTLQYYLLPYLEEFSRQYPKIKINVTNGPTPVTLEYLLRGKIDFGIVTAPVSDIKGMNVIPVGKIQDVFIANHRFGELQSKSVDVAELAKYPLICLEKNTSTRKYVDEFLYNKAVVLNPEFELATSELIVQFAMRSMGIGCVVKNFTQKLLEEGKLFEIRLRNPIPPRDICLATLDRNPITPAGKKLLDLIKA